LFSFKSGYGKFIYILGASRNFSINPKFVAKVSTPTDTLKADLFSYLYQIPDGCLDILLVKVHTAVST
jgi:hypothetical protein